MLADGVIEGRGRGRGPTDTVAAGNFECDTCSDNYDISIFLYIINTLCLKLSLKIHMVSTKSVHDVV
jgi:hypothetical protein